MNGGQPLEQHSFVDGLVYFRVFRGHFVARAPVYDQSFGSAQTFRGARSVERSVAAPVYQDAASQYWRYTGFDGTQQAEGIQNLARILGGDVGAFGEMGADGQEHGVELLLFPHSREIVHFGVELYVDSEGLDARDLGVENIPGQAVFGDAEAHHAARFRAGFVYCDAMTQAAQVIGRGEPARPGSDDQDAVAGLRRRLVELPAVLDGLVTQEPFDGVDVQRLIDLRAIAFRFA